MAMLINLEHGSKYEFPGSERNQIRLHQRRTRPEACNVEHRADHHHARPERHAGFLLAAIHRFSFRGRTVKAMWIPQGEIL